MQNGMDIIKETLYGSTSYGPEPIQGMMESGIASIRESLYGPEPTVNNVLYGDGNFTKQDYLEEASRIVDFLYNSNNNSFIESGLSEIGKSLGYNMKTIFESPDEATRYMANGLWILTEAAKKDDKIAEIKAKIDALDDKPNAPKTLCAVYAALVIVFMAAGYMGIGATAFAAGSQLAALQSTAMMILTSLGLGLIIGWVGKHLIGLGVQAIRYFTTYIYNKITGNNVAPPNEKLLAIKDMISTVEKYAKKCRETGQPEKAKQLMEIKMDLQNRLDEIQHADSFVDRMA